MGKKKIREIRFTDPADKDLQSILKYFEGEALPLSGRQTVKKLVAHAERLAAFPRSGRVVPEYGLEWIREVIVAPYRMVYRSDLEDILILRIQRSEKLMKL